jgi:lipopolysaccharide biosynthesis regulator YciM
MALEDDDLRHLMAAEGYLELGMPLEANEELERIEPDVRHVPEVLEVRLAIYRTMKRWELMQTIAARLAQYDPNETRWALSLAYATRRAESIAAARVILLEAVRRHPEVAMFHFNLACYDSQLGDIAGAKAWLQTAIAIKPKLRESALEDPDLEPLWQSL